MILKTLKGTIKLFLSKTIPFSSPSHPQDLSRSFATCDRCLRPIAAISSSPLLSLRFATVVGKFTHDSFKLYLNSFKFAHYIRTSLYIWYGDIRVLPSSCIEHFWQHKGSIMGKKSSSIWWTVWASAVWGIWLHRNDQLYNDKPIDSGIVLDTIFPGAWSWCKIFVKDFDASLYAWNVNPREWLMQLE
ncbi:hypothetical protein JHK86_043395 [Glycine max]|nr:hypothetical protein JHK86_043395 [Glycine max]